MTPSFSTSESLLMNSGLYTISNWAVTWLIQTPAVGMDFVGCLWISLREPKRKVLVEEGGKHESQVKLCSLLSLIVYPLLRDTSNLSVSWICKGQKMSVHHFFKTHGSWSWRELCGATIAPPIRPANSCGGIPLNGPSFVSWPLQPWPVVRQICSVDLSSLLMASPFGLLCFGSVSVMLGHSLLFIGLILHQAIRTREWLTASTICLAASDLC